MWTGPRVRVPLLVTGHPRCGTTSASDICKRANLDIGMEAIGKHGIASWMLAVDDVNPYGFDVVARSRRNLRWDAMVFVVRDLKDAAPSVILENLYEPPSFKFRRRHIQNQFNVDIGQCPDDLTAAVLSIVYWIRIILKQNPALWFRVEDQQSKLRDFALQMFASAPPESQDTASVRSNVDKPYSGEKRDKPILTQNDWNRLSESAKADVAWYGATFGYPSPLGA
jgi:hypothetical protein